MMHMHTGTHTDVEWQLEAASPLLFARSFELLPADAALTGKRQTKEKGSKYKRPVALIVL